MSNLQRIRLDGIELDIRTIKAEPRHGPHSGKELAGLDVEVVAHGKEAARTLEGLLKKPSLNVDDPISGRQYVATVSQRSSMYMEGRPEHFFTLSIVEVDVVPEVHQIEIDGQRFEVLKYVEKMHENVVGRYVLLKLTGEQLTSLRKKFGLDPVSVLRVGVDNEPMSCRFGGAMYWSHHDEAETRFYKQIVRLFPSQDRPKSRPIGFVPLAEHRALARMNLALLARFETLLEHLAFANIVSPEKKAELLREDWKSLVDEDWLIETNEELRRVPDAESELN